MSNAKPLPAVDFLKIPETGDPYLEGHEVQEPAAPSTSARAPCARSAARATSSRRRSSRTKGKLYVYSIVHRSFPGVEVPYVSAIVDLEGGGTLKGNLINVEPDPKKIKFDMPVEVDHQGRGPQGPRRQFLPRYFFQPRAA